MLKKFPWGMSRPICGRSHVEILCVDIYVCSPFRPIYKCGTVCPLCGSAVVHLFASSTNASHFCTILFQENRFITGHSTLLSGQDIQVFFFFGLVLFSPSLFLFVPPSLSTSVICLKQEAISLTAASQCISGSVSGAAGAHHFKAISTVTRPDAPPFFSALRLSVLFASDKEPGRVPSMETRRHFG